MMHMKILVVDDEEAICEEFRDILGDEGYDVDIALNGEDALRKIQDTDYAIVFLDVLMPKMEGREVFERIKRLRPVPVAIMSGYIPPNKEREILALGAIACFKKPLDLSRIKSLLASLEDK